LRFNVNNLFNKYYFGNISTVSTLGSQPRYSVGAPRTLQLAFGLDF
jgi:outer membrane receptor for ferric coprogen and ferric-rhodotorulic acid